MSAAALVAPVVLGVVAWVPFVRALRRGRRTRAAAWIAGWAVLLMVALPIVEAAAPGWCASRFPGAGAYGEAMRTWAVTGVGCESSPSCFIPQHLVHAVLFAAAALLSAGAGALVMAAVLFGWMGAYAGALGALGGQTWVAALAAWHPWALVRVAAYIALGTALAEPLARRGRDPLPGRGRWLLAGLVGLVLDIALKALLAPTWWRLVIHPLLAGGS